MQLSSIQNQLTTHRANRSPGVNGSSTEAAARIRQEVRQKAAAQALKMQAMFQNLINGAPGTRPHQPGLENAPQQSVTRTQSNTFDAPGVHATQSQTATVSRPHVPGGENAPGTRPHQPGLENAPQQSVTQTQSTTIKRPGRPGGENAPKGQRPGARPPRPGRPGGENAPKSQRPK